MKRIILCRSVLHVYHVDSRRLFVTVFLGFNVFYGVVLFQRTVMEAVTAILGGELRVGLLLQGKKIRDDNRTLQQSGISHSGDLDNLGFTLEPTSIAAQASSPVSHKDSPFLQSCVSHKQLPR